jgi:hypothetical protein
VSPSRATCSEVQRNCHIPLLYVADHVYIGRSRFCLLVLAVWDFFFRLHSATNDIPVSSLPLMQPIMPGNAVSQEDWYVA